jgi:NADH-quinone oxidoreductase subunit C
MMTDLNALRADIEKRYTVLGVHEKRTDFAVLECEAREIPDVLACLRDSQGYVHLSFFTCVDLIEDNLLELVYMLRSHEKKHDLAVKARISRDNPVMQTIHTHWAAAATYERELREMFGISFPGCPRVEEDFALEGWQGPPPMRRDFDTRKYSEETYFPRPGRSTNDPAEHMKKTQYPGRADL